MVEKVHFINEIGEALDINLRKPEECGYYITSITGLEPIDVDIKTSQYTSGIRYKYISGFHKLRDIGFTFIYDEYNENNLSIQDLRDNLYYYLSPNNLVKMVFEIDDNRKLYIEGYPQNHKSTMFSDQCGATVSVLCPELWFYEAEYDNEDEKWKIKTTEVSMDKETVEDYDIYKIILENDNVYKGNFRTGFEIIIGSGNRFDSEIVFGSYNGFDSIETHAYIPSNSEGYNKKIIYSTVKENLGLFAEIDNKLVNKIGWVDANNQYFRSDMPLIKPGNRNEIYVKTKNLGGDTSPETLTLSYTTLYIGV